MSRPVRFSGTREQAAINFASHYFWYGDPDEYADTRCMDCDSRPSHAAAWYPCGADVPRVA